MLHLHGLAASEDSSLFAVIISVRLSQDVFARCPWFSRNMSGTRSRAITMRTVGSQGAKCFLVGTKPVCVRSYAPGVMDCAGQASRTANRLINDRCAGCE